MAGVCSENGFHQLAVHRSASGISLYIEFKDKPPLDWMALLQKWRVRRVTEPTFEAKPKARRQKNATRLIFGSRAAARMIAATGRITAVIRYRPKSDDGPRRRTIRSHGSRPCRRS